MTVPLSVHVDGIPGRLQSVFASPSQALIKFMDIASQNC